LPAKESDIIIKWKCKSFNELTNEELYKILQLRIEVFAVEQNVVYQDCDNKDFESYHFTGSINNSIYCVQQDYSSRSVIP
jgi:predicted GNAT family N-acyltransferase